MTDEPDHSSELHPPSLGSTTTALSKDASAAPKAPKPSGPIPMSMPSILRNPGVPTSTNHLSSHVLRSSSSPSSSYPPAAQRLKPRSGSAKELGRRKQRRSENARLLSNPHAVRPTLKDYRLYSNPISPTFTCLASGSSGKQYSIPVPAQSGIRASEPSHDANSARQGHFGKSLRDAQRILKRLEVGNINDRMVRERKAGELERFIWLVDREIRHWAEAEIHLYPSSNPSERKTGRVLLDTNFDFTSPPFLVDGGQGAEKSEAGVVELDSLQPNQGGQLIEFQRTPNALVWLIHDPFLRLIVHCLARVSRCPSFSKDDSSRPGLRFTWILNRNPMARRSRRGRRVSVSSSAISSSPAPVLGAESAGARVARAAIGGTGSMAGMETPPTTDFDSATESELGPDTETESEGSLADSLTLQQPPPPLVGRGGDEGEEAVETDQDEAEILRRVRRWAIDSHRQRNADGEAAEGARESKTKLKQVYTEEEEEMDPDATLTADAIVEEEDEDEVGSYTSA